MSAEMDVRWEEMQAAFGAMASSSTLPREWQLITIPTELALIHKISADAFQFNGQRVGMANPNDLKCRLVLVEKGSLSVMQWSGHRRLGPGEAVLLTDVNGNELHASGPIELIILALPIWWCLRELAEATRVITETFIPAGFIGASALAQLVRAMAEKGNGVWVASAGRLLSALLKEALLAQVDEHEAARQGAVFTERRMQEIFAFICLNYGQEGLSARDAAAALGYSLRTVHKTCAARGTSFTTLLMETRLSAAAYQLSLGTERISEIAYEAGFSSLSHFCRLFRQRFGLSAGEYRRGVALPLGGSADDDYGDDQPAHTASPTDP